DNPRFEEPSAIISEIEEGVKKEFDNYDVVVDRRKAIEKAIKKASAGDIVIIAGKGHENYQIVRDKVFSFDDREIAREILKERK
ncbi:MAG: UDP-N-acetylmuramoyl-L-alanyl-D-glutamate--2,6-diaminopimelate ligase, partial [Candidatus Omnitrophica bacterium]|nr:UDP-N-acetylmuramoyl-L-alanyl-D-glutamate--2,6-diaminopimelate ligase [Candidatus Omnitrophota bacterium]